MSASPNVVPLKVPRLVALSLAWAWGVVAGSAGLNALIKSNQEKSKLKHHTPAPAYLVININDVFHPGVIATAISAFISVLCSTYILLLLLPKSNRFNQPIPLSTRTLSLQACSLTFCAVWLFTVQIPFTHNFRTHSAQVHAFIGKNELPAQTVKAAEKALGVTSVYNKMDYLRLTAIFPWFTILFTVAAAIVTFMAISRARTFPTIPAQTETEKEQVSHSENSV